MQPILGDAAEYARMLLEIFESASTVYFDMGRKLLNFGSIAPGRLNGAEGTVNE